MSLSVRLLIAEKKKKMQKMQKNAKLSQKGNKVKNDKNSLSYSPAPQKWQAHVMYHTNSRDQRSQKVCLHVIMSCPLPLSRYRKLTEGASLDDRTFFSFLIIPYFFWLC